MADQNREVGGLRAGASRGGEGRRLRAQRRVVRRRAVSLVLQHSGGVHWGGVPRAVVRGGAAAQAVRARGRRVWSPRGAS